MACYHPRMMVAVGKNPSGRTKYVFIPYNEQERGQPDVVVVPCGKCIGCKLEYSKQWANRCMLEASLYPREWSHFLTLTYNDENLPIRRYGDHNQYKAYSLDKPALSAFLKRLRSYYKDHFDHDGIRFFGCGEYGNNTFRPHYHLLLFNCPIDDIQTIGKNALGDLYYRSDVIEQCWHFGFVTIGEVSWESCAYVARYVTKKAGKNKPNEFYYDHHIQPEFVLMSRRPGIGRGFYEQNRDRLYQFDSVYLSGEKGSKEIRPPKYFDRLMENDDPDTIENLKALRKVIADEQYLITAGNSDLSYLEQCKVKELYAINRTKILNKRGDL